MMHVTGNEQIGKVGVPLDPFVITLTDENGEPRFEEPVEFRLMKGAGALTGVDTMTGTDGRATGVFTPSAPGRYRIEVDAADGQELRTHAFVGIVEEASVPAEPPGASAVHSAPCADSATTEAPKAETPKEPSVVPSTPRQKPRPTRVQRIAEPKRSPPKQATPRIGNPVLLGIAAIGIAIVLAAMAGAFKTEGEPVTVIDASRCAVEQLSVEGNDLVFDNCATVTH